MKRLLILVMMTSLAVVGCGGLAATPPTTPGAPIAEGPTVQAEDGGITMTVRVRAAVHRPTHPVVVTVTAKNTGKVPIPWIGNSGCDNGLYARVMTPQGEGWFELRSDGPPMACTTVMTEGKLEPGAQIQAEYVWDQLVDGVPAPPGNHTIVAGFRRGVHYDQIKPAEVQAEIRLEGGEAFLRREDAVKVATDLLENWFQTHTGAAVVKQEGGEWFVLMARNSADPTGEWIKSSSDHVAEATRQRPETSAEFKDGGWEVRFFTKLGPAPRDRVVFVTGTTGEGRLIK